MRQLSKLLPLGLLIFALLAVYSCGDATTTDSGTTSGGNTGELVGEQIQPSANIKFANHTNKDSRKPQIGEVVYYHYIMRTEHETVRSSHTNGQVAYFQIPDPTKVTGTLSPMLQGLMRMSLGDSLTVSQTLEKDAFRADAHADANFLFYDLTLKDIKSMEEFQQDMRNKTPQHPLK